MQKSSSDDVHLKYSSAYNFNLIERETARVEIFSDAVFAIVITLLVLDIRTPSDYMHDPYGSIFRLWPSVASYMLSFLTIGMYWMAHHNIFNFIKKTNRTMMWLNLVFLMSISLLPFPAHLIGIYDGIPLSPILYGSILIFINTSLFIFWTYVARMHKLVSSTLPSEVVEWIQYRTLVSIVLCSFGVVVSLYYPHIAYFIYTFTIVRFIIPGKIEKILGRMKRLKTSFANFLTS